MKFCVLASGSKGNCILVESRNCRVLVDVGLSAREIERRLQRIDTDPTTIDAIVLTHAHNDHVRGVGVFSRRFGVPVHGHPETLDSINRLLRPEQELHCWNDPFTIKDLTFKPFPVSHDCVPTVGYLIDENGRRLALCTDLGVVTEEVKSNIRTAQAMLLESNHDPDMLMNGPYPWHLKERISSRVGHLSNHNTGELLQEILHPGLRKVVLGHLSENNNTPDLARETVCDYLSYQAESLIDVIEQKSVSRLYDV